MPQHGDAEFFATAPLIRHDLETGFVARSPDAEERHGWLMGYVIDRASRTSDLAILDATTLADVAGVHIPHVVPPGFHGNWIPA